VVPAVTLVNESLQIAVEFVLPTVSVTGAHNCGPVVEPDVNVTLPVGTTVPDGAETVAVNVTD
jgi:hypothetical protein